MAKGLKPQTPLAFLSKYWRVIRDQSFSVAKFRNLSGKTAVITNCWCFYEAELLTLYWCSSLSTRSLHELLSFYWLTRCSVINFFEIFDSPNYKHNAAGDEMKANTYFHRSKHLRGKDTQIPVLIILTSKDAILAVLVIKICGLFMKDVWTGTL